MATRTFGNAGPVQALNEQHIRMPDEGDRDTFAKNPKSPAEPLPSQSYTAPASSPTDLQGMKNVLNKMNSHFIFPIGMPGAGKTVAVHSILRYLQTSHELGKVHPLKSPWQAVDKTDEVLNEVATMITKGRLPKSTQVNAANIAFQDTKQANYEFKPRKNGLKPLRITFVDSDGQNYDKFAIGSELPPGIDVFFKVGGMSLTFLLMTSHEHAARDDQLFSKFLGYIAQQDPAFRSARAVIVLTKWDTYHGTDSHVQYIKRYMPLTYTATRNPANALMCFSVGSILPIPVDENGATEWLKEFNPAPAAVLFKWIYKSINGKGLDDKPWWHRFFKAV